MKILGCIREGWSQCVGVYITLNCESLPYELSMIPTVISGGIQFSSSSV